MTPVIPEYKPVHTILALGIVVLFASSYVMPYFFAVPAGPAGQLIMSAGETIKNMLILVLGYYFGSTSSTTRRNDMITQAALAPAAPPAPGTAQVTAAADVNVDVTAKDDPAP